MIKLEHVVLASPQQMDFIIEGMRNPKNSWGKSDSKICYENGHVCATCANVIYCMHHGNYILGGNDHSLMQSLSDAGSEHRKHMRTMPVYVRITAPLYWWKEFDTYKIGTTSNACSTMHKIAEKEFTLEDFSCEHLNSIGTSSLLDVIDILNRARTLYLEGGDYKGEHYDRKDKQVWWQLIQLLPSSYNQIRNITMNYEVLIDIYRQRKKHKLDEWREFCKWIESLPYSELIIGPSIESDQAFEEKYFPHPFPRIKKDDVYCDNCEHFHDCLNKGGLVDVTTSDDIAKNGFGRQHYINKPGCGCPKKSNEYDTAEYGQEYPEWAEKIIEKFSKEN